MVRLFGKGIATFLLLVGMILIALVPIAIYQAGEQFLSFVGFGLLSGLLLTAIGLFSYHPPIRLSAAIQKLARPLTDGPFEPVIDCSGGSDPHAA